MNLILEKTDKVKYFTNMRDVFSALRIHCSDFDWYVSDVETNGFSLEEGWHRGSDLALIINNNEIQFIWAVFSAVPKGLRSEVINPPCVDGNPNYWNGSNPTPQLAEASFEIACWDSSATLLIGVDFKMAANFQAAYPDAIELSGAAR